MVRAKQDRLEKLQSTQWRRVVKPCPSSLKAQGSARTPSLDTVLAIRALDAEHFGLVVARGGHHNGGIPAGRQGSEVGLGTSSIPDHQPQPSSEVLHYPLRPRSLSMDLWTKVCPPPWDQTTRALKEEPSLLPPPSREGV